MEFVNDFSVPVPIDQAWSVLMDIERIAPCLPGAELTELLGPDSYKGLVNIRLGPMAFSFTGTAQIEDRNDRDYTAKVVASGNDNKGRGSARSVVHFSLEPAGKETRVMVRTDMQLSGSVAQFGRGAGIINDVAASLVAQFEQNLRLEIADEQALDGQARPLQSVTGAPETSRQQPIGIVNLVLAAIRSWLTRLIKKPFKQKP